MKKYVLGWQTTECYGSYLQSLDKETAEFDNLKEAKAAFDKELKATRNTKVSDLDYDPSDDECRHNLTNLYIALADTEDDTVFEDVETSDNYWINE
ncbi:hypothetical protein [Prevotella sp. KH2C16]|uniref:hypothetical protein n=1 Tax=Prevotella sp. KH2C16 TaxID=1855325 RepID=UPI0008E476C1|nr:hypothetical protein [Prevotella sp. KH2C16]SFG38230.1 hypothetical protein SAMN05216383_11212 [Prevotella sp. KH2C16]SFG75499.1 hypothetical protein SAMN05216383_13910 [Prevotella sp. KH2C16]